MLNQKRSKIKASICEYTTKLKAKRYTKMYGKLQLWHKR